MSPDIWTQCAPKFKFSSYQARPWRVVEAQHIVATRKLVDSDEEQAILEDLIEGAKPPKFPKLYDKECSIYHYLLWTPFRYPPLKNGSRFGRPDQRGLWYGSEELETAFAEKAYYIFLLRAGSLADFGVFDAAKTAFQVQVATNKCANLMEPPFNRFEREISAQASYSESQKMGDELRKRNVEVIRFRSARSGAPGSNTVVFALRAFKERKPSLASTWFCISSEESVEFKPIGLQTLLPKQTVFKRIEFEVNGKLPSPQF